MKTIYFSANNTDNLNPTFDVSDINHKREYLCILNIEGLNLLFTKLIPSKNNLNNLKIDVREVEQDFYSNGEIVTYSNQLKSEICLKLEKLLNSGQASKLLADGMEVEQILGHYGIQTSVLQLGNIFFSYGHELDESYVTSINLEVFEALKEMKTHSVYGQMSMWGMYKTIQELSMLKNNIKKI